MAPASTMRSLASSSPWARYADSIAISTFVNRPGIRGGSTEAGAVQSRTCERIGTHPVPIVT
jgi:hypothetical protein